ncbi:MAG: DUF2339 domain-containing protein [Lentisphaeria bacterium]|nr:DUF2339 domain-containing protein [Lentisphaeria bacterium]
MPNAFIFLMPIFTGVFSFISLIILMGCSSMLKDLSFRIRRLEKHLNVDGLAKQPASPPKQPEVRIQVPGTTESKPVPGFLLSNQPAANPPQNQPENRPEVKSAAVVTPENKPEVKPEAPAPSVVKPEVKPMPVQTPAQVVSPVKPEPPHTESPKQVKPEIKPAAAAANTSETFDTKAMLNVPKESSAWMAGTKPAGASHFAPQRSAIEERTAEVLSKLWQWIVVGEEYRKGGMPKEYAIATTWMLRAAVLLIVFGLTYFIKYTHDRNLLPPELRLSVAALFTMALLGVGCRLLKGAKYRIFGTALAGAGFTGLYLCVFASVSVYHLLSPLAGLAGLVVVTAAGVALALRFNSILLAVLAVCGGYLAPILMDTGSRNLAGLYGYMLILVVGSLVVARMRSWQPVNILSFLFTWGIYAASNPFPGHGTYSMPYVRTDAWLEHADLINHDYTVAIAAGTLFFLAFCVQTVVYNLYTKRKVSLLELGFAALNGIVFMSLAIPPTIRIYGREYAAAVTFGGALVYLLQLALLIRVKLEDRNLLLTLLVFACGLISLTFPLLLNQDHLAVAWSAQAAAMLYIACRTRSVILLRLSYIVYMVAAVRLLGFDLARGYWRHSVTFWTRLLNFGSYTAALAGGFFLLNRYSAELMPASGRSADDGSRPVYSRSSKAMFWCAFGVSFLLIAGEFTYLPHLKVGGVVVTAALYLLILSLIPRLFRENRTAIRIAGGVLLCVFLWYVIVSWQSGGNSVRDSLWRFFPNLLAVAALFFAGTFFGAIAKAEDGDRAEGKTVSRFFILSALVLWFVYSTDETYFLVDLYSSSRGGARIAVSLLWGVYALALLAFGILRGKKVVRIPALVLFAVTVLKIFLIDLAGTPALYRIAGCMITGAVLIAGAWLYARFAQKGDPSDETRP